MLDYKTPKGYMKYNEFVRKLAKPGSQILAELNPDDCHRLHMAVGISGEAGELLDAVKKATIYRKPLDIANIREECGDLLFYIAGMLDSIGATLDDVAAENVAKLSIRYGKSYSNEAAIQRADKDHGSEVKTEKEPDDDFNEIVPRACNLDDEECESCQ
jgi:NTP pyrophosphatase (non-canonical NTP hydrolase)